MKILSLEQWIDDLDDASLGMADPDGSNRQAFEKQKNFNRRIVIHIFRLAGNPPVMFELEFDEAFARPEIHNAVAEELSQ